MTDRELMQQALDALEEAQDYTSCPTYSPSMTQQCAIAAVALRARLAQPELSESVEPAAWFCAARQLGKTETVSRLIGEWPDNQPEPEPVAWTTDLEFDRDTEIIPANEKGKLGTGLIDIPLYTAPPQRDFKFSTIEEAKQPVPTPPEQPQLTDDETRFANAFTALIKAGYGKEAEIVLKCKREWQGLTDDEVQEFLDNRAMSEWCGAGHVHLLPYTFARAIEAKLKEKNDD